jgi:DNA topoisomerase-2
MLEEQTPAIPTRSIEDFFDNEYRGYAIYTIENRAIPSVVDGFKPSQRKIAYAANRLWKTGAEKPMKVFQLGGQAAAISFFHHGSLDGTIIGMTQEFKNSMPMPAVRPGTPGGFTRTTRPMPSTSRLPSLRENCR